MRYAYISIQSNICVRLVCVSRPQVPNIQHKNILFSVKNGVWNKSKTENFIRRYCYYHFPSLILLAGFFLSSLIYCCCCFKLRQMNFTKIQTHTHSRSHAIVLYTPTHARMHTHIRAHTDVKYFYISINVEIKSQIEMSVGKRETRPKRISM